MSAEVVRYAYATGIKAVPSIGLLLSGLVCGIAIGFAIGDAAANPPAVRQTIENIKNNFFGKKPTQHAE